MPYDFTEGSGAVGASIESASRHYPVVAAVGGTIGNGRKTVTTADTPETLVGSTTACVWIVVQALPSNTSWVSVGGSSTDAQGNSTFSGLVLSAGESTPPLPIDDVQKVYVDADVSGEGVSFVYVDVAGAGD